MSTTVDNRVVEMRFDNRQFEQNVSTTMSSLDKLKEKLKLRDSSKGLESLNTAANRVDMSGLSGAVETVRTKFSALQVVAVTALSNITNSAVNAGKRMASALTIDPIKTGFQEYETQINAVQTILANTESKGTTLQQVNAALDTLNTYADKTIYNFTEMTKNIGTFTAAGVDLDTSVSAIQGIANLAAVSGSTSQQASTAMYQLSQALASGTVKLMDWNSVVNAGMGGQVFQDALKQTARVHGVAIDKMIEKNGSFRETLSEGWLTTDILTETLNQFTMAAEEGTEEWEAYKKSLMDSGYSEEQALSILKMANTATDAATKVKTFTQLWDTLKESAQSGWTQSWEIMIGDFNEAKEFLTDISDRVGEMIGTSAEARNEMLSGGLSSGWKQLLNEGIADEEGYKETLISVAKEHNIAFDDMIKKTEEAGGTFEDALVKGLKDGKISSDMLSESVHKMADKMSNMSAEELKAAGYTVDHVKQIKELSAGLKDGSISMDEFVKKMQRTSGRENIIQALWNAFDGLMSVIKPVKEAFREIFPAITGEQLYSFTEALAKLTEKLTLSSDASEKLKRAFKGVFAFIDIVNRVSVAIFKGLIPTVGDLGGGFLNFTANIGDSIVKFNEFLKSSDAFTKVTEKIRSALGKVIGFFKIVWSGVKTVAESISSAFSDISSNAEVRFQPLVTLGNFIKSIFVGIGKIIEKVFPYIASAAKGIGNVLKSLMDKITSSIQDADYDGLFDVANGGIITAIGVFIAKFIKSGGDLLDNASGFLENIKNILSGVSDAINAFTESIKAETLKKIAISIGILAAALFVLSLIDSEKLTTSLVAITVLFGELMGAMQIFTKIIDGKTLKNINKVGRAMISLSAAVLILSAALKIMSTMTWEEMAIGLTAMVVGLGALVGAVNLLPEKNITKSAKAIKKLSKAVLILAIGIKIMSTMSWEEMAIGLIAMVVGLGALVGAVNLLPKDAALRSAGMIGLATAMVILAAALKIMATMSWDDVARSLITLGGSLLILVAALNLMKKAIPGAIAMLIVAPALLVLAGVLKIMATMSWEEIAKGLVSLAGSLGILAGAMALMKKSIAGAVAMKIIAPALIILAAALKTMGAMSWEEIARGLILLAGAFIIIGVAAKVLGPLVGTIYKLSGALALLGLACAAIGAGVLMLGIGLGSISAAGAGAAVALTTIVSSIISLIPYLIEQIGVGIIKLCEVISGGASAICEAVKVIILAVVDALVASVPALVEGLLVLIDELLASLADHAPSIVGSILDFLIGVLNALAEKMPDLIQAGVDLLMSIFSGFIDALKSVDPSTLVNGFLAVGVVTAMMTALALIAALTPAAMVGVIGLGAVISELALVLAAIGELAKIPGLDWLITEGGNIMEKVGTAIGQFVGGIAGGIAKGFTSSLPEVGTNLSDFMTNIQPFIDGAKTIDPSALEGVKTLTGVIAALTVTNLLDGLTSWLTGGSSLADFGAEIAAFGPYMKQYSDAVTGIDPAAVEASASAAQALSELAKGLPNSGGLAGWFAGENDIRTFGEQLVPFGKGMKSYSDSISGFNPEAVIASANAAKSLVDMASCIPNEGGVAAWFAGENSIAKFGTDLESLGVSLSAYSNSISGFDAEAVIASANAAKALADMTSCIPNEGGVVAWFTGENSIAKFGTDLVVLGNCLSAYSNSISGFDPEAVIASANAAKALADMTSCIPNEGGMVAWFTGENSIAKFGTDLIMLGTGLLGFSLAVSGVNAENVSMATNAAKALADMASCIPNEGGVVSWFTGENSIAKFGTELIMLGNGLLGFSLTTAGIVPENITAAANAAKAIADMASTIPNEGGVVAWFTGDNSIAKFGSSLPILGKGLASFSASVEGINPENITAAANAAKSIADMVSVIPNEGGVVAWFTGESSIANFGDALPTLGEGLKGFSDAIEGIAPENITIAASVAKVLADMTSYIPNEGGVAAWFAGENSISKFGDDIVGLGEGLKGFSDEVENIVPENIIAAANAAKALAEMTSVIPNEGGIVAWFTGENSIANFADKLPTLGEGLKGFSDEVENIVPENIIAAANAAKSLAEMADTTPKNTDKIINFGENLVTFGEKLKSYFDKVDDITIEAITTSSNAIKKTQDSMSDLKPDLFTKASDALGEMIKTLNKMAKVKADSADGFSSTIEKIGETNVDSLIDTFKNAGSDMKKAGQDLVKNFTDGVKTQNADMVKAGQTAIERFAYGLESRNTKAKNVCKNIVSSCSTAIRDKYSKFKSAGSYLVDGFAEGITSRTWKAEAKAKAMANAAEKAAKKALDVNSPSKVFRALGYSVPEGFAIGIDRMGGLVKTSATDMAKTAINNVKRSISKIADAINTDIDSQPTIRPVLDLSDVRSGASTIGGLFDTNPSVGVLANVGAISSMMNRNGQNGGNAEVVSAIDKLRKDLGNVGNTTYNVNGVTYDDGSNVKGAVEQIVRAARIGRRV